jgi:hypothetical protein
MSDLVGKICPFCKTAIQPDEEMKVCNSCQMPHHQSCWDENKGCTTFGCVERDHSVRTETMVNRCVKCNAVLQQNTVFCSQCGHKVGSSVDATVEAKINQFNSGINAGIEKKQNKKPIIFATIGISVVIAVVAIVTLTGKPKNFQELFPECDSESWCDVSADGSYMIVDTNPADWDNDLFYEDCDRDGLNADYYELLDCGAKKESYAAIEDINSELGFSSSVYMKMGQTRALDGRVTESNDNYSISWTYHPDNGLEVMYELNGD